MLPVAEHPAPACLDRLEHEYGLKADLDSEWAVRPLEFIRDGQRALLVLEDFDGTPLDRLLGAPLETGQFLRLAIGIASTLGKAHQRGLLHKDIKPTNIFVNPATGEARLTGFGIASRLPRERQSPEPPEFIAGTLPYMPPEQTGRMNRSIDSRSDLYSLGVTFYEMLTGSLPFHARDPTEWVHCHIARQPVAPCLRTKDVPAAVSAIVMKLLSKTAEERYQSAGGLQWDLHRCLKQWEASRRIDVFPLGTHDTTHHLLIPEKLYGRDAQIRTLLDAFERVVAQGKPQLILVSGYSGIGKSSVVNELHKVIVLPRGIFISGKFDLRLRDIPYSTLAQAFQGLIRQILNSPPADIDEWRDAIQQAVGKHGCLLTDLIPELVNLIGPQPMLPVLSPLETQLRFQSVFQNFVGVFAKAEHPLVIFVDDLQWLDPATLTVIEYLITDADTHHLLVIGAYRDNEVGPEHPLVSTLKSIRQAGTTVHEIVLEPLSVDDFNHLLCDALRCTREQAEPLAALVHRKTGGNPFFAGQFLTNLAEEGLLEFEPVSSSWRWDLAVIDAKGFTENVVDLMVRRLQRLPPSAQAGLKRLACLGSQADFDTLAKMRGCSEAEVHADFGDAVRAGAIMSTERSFKFLHDRVQEAAYALIEPERRAEHHLTVGRMLLASMDEHEVAARIFDIANQLNLGASLMVERGEQQRAATLNLRAARKAKASTAYSSACSYLAAAITMLGAQGWDDCYELTFSVWFERADCEFLDSNFAEAAQWVDKLSMRARSKTDRAEIYRLRMVLQLVQGENALAVRTALECLRMFGIELQACPTTDQVRNEYEAVWARLGERPIASLVDLPDMEDAEMHAVMNVFSTLWRSAYLTDSNLCQSIACRMVNVTQQYGTTESAVIGYALLAIFLGPFFGRYQDGEAFARLAVAVAEKHGFAAQKVGANFLMQMALLWTKPIEEAVKCVDAAIVAAQETGEIVYACYSLEHRLTDLLARGDHLDELWLESVKALEFVERIRFRHVRDVLASIQPFIQRLRGHADDQVVIDEAAVVARLIEAGIAVVVCYYWILQIQRHFLLGEPDEALECAAEAKPLLWSARCHIQFANYCMYESLALGAVHGAASDERRAEIRAEIAENLRHLEKWAQSCPATFAHKHWIVSAELARIEGRETEALRLCERAARRAGEYGFVQEQALANELAGQCCIASGLELAAQAYLREARDGYYRWGALGKVAQLDRRYPSNKPDTPPVPSGTIEESAERLDIATIVRTSQAISGEIVLENLIKSLMVIAIEHAGAERGLLILQRGAEQRIEAEATIHGGNVAVMLPECSVPSKALPASVLHYVVSTHESVILDDASVGNRFCADPYIRQRRARSVFCLPLLKQAKLIGVLYLENNLAPSVFAPARIAVLKLLASQAAIALENARLYRELAEREARIRRLVDANIIGIFIWNIEGCVLEANDALLRILGYERGDLTSGRLSWRELTPPQCRERDEQALAEVIASGTALPYEKEFVGKDGILVPVLIGAALFETGGKEGVAFVVDLTERKRAEEDARRSERRYREVQRELAHANRVTTMGQLAASISHEIKQPIASTATNAQAALRWLMSCPPNLDEVRESLEWIVKNAARATDVINRIRGLVKNAPTCPEQLAINQAIREVIALIRTEAVQNGVSVRTRLAENLPLVEGDRVQLQQVVLNLTMNAVEAMSSVDDGPRELVVGTVIDESGDVAVEVCDSGPGITPENADRLFEPFYTTKETGMGVGLSICRSIVEAHGGRISVSANSPRGAVFRFTCPTAPRVQVNASR